MPGLVEIGGALGIIAVIVIATVIKSYKGGSIGAALSQLRAKQRDQKLADIHDTVRHTDQKVNCVERKVDDIGEAIVVLHEDDENVDVDALRDKVDVSDLSGDIRRGD